jgi:hypothetical protein
MTLASLSGWQGAGSGLAVGAGVFLATLVAERFKLGVFWIFYGVFTLTLIWTIIR